MRIIQLSDIHIFSDETKIAKKHLSNFEGVIDFIRSNIVNINADFVIVTGDISHDGGVLSYEKFFSLMKDIPLPFYVIPGNHDDKKNLYNVGLKYGNNYDVNSFEDDEWRILGIDSVVDNEDYGLIQKNEFDFLENEVQLNSNKKIALFLHHHPIPVGTPIVDDCMLINASELLSSCRALKIKFIGSGHAHTLFQRKIGEALVSISPAVCSQWRNATKEVDSIDNSAFSVVDLGEHVRVEPWFI
ncbi:metallophosphoesterase family protein [Serratia liquefaciens]|uniref:metallophosphoesterase family protein n=1 Tax=Serratia liquefaciens TaxID=614 RepID=UPI0022B9D9B5|nr:metallophosphoesterase [Serratia liquefaciens]